MTAGPPLSVGTSTAHLPGGDTTALGAALAADGLRLEELIAVGGSAAVYRARDTKHDRAVAVKVLRPDRADAASAERFSREVAVVAQLRHPHILPLYDSGTTAEGARYFVMPLAEGTTLRRRLTAGPLAVADAVRLATEVADALAYAHAAGVVHRDVKPENVLLEAGHAVVSDFGLALDLRAGAGRHAAGDAARAEGERASDPGTTSWSGERLTAAGAVAGTTEYMSPEQAAGERELDGRSDTYSLACVVYEMLAGEPPFTGGDARAVLARRFREAPRPLTERRRDVPAALDAAVRRALAVDPADRFASVGDFAAALQRAIVADPPRRRAPLLLLVAIALVVLAGALMRREAPVTPAAVPAALDSTRVLVAVPDNETGDPRLDPVAHLVAAQIRDGLAETRYHVVTSVSVLPALRDARAATATLDDPARLGALAVEARAATVVAGSYYRLPGGELEFIVEITDARSGDLLRAVGPVHGRIDAVDRIADQLRRRVVATLDSLVPAPR